MTNAGTCIAGYGRTHRVALSPYVSYSNILWDVDQLEVNVCETGYGRVLAQIRPVDSRGLSGPKGGKRRRKAAHEEGLKWR